MFVAGPVAVKIGIPNLYYGSAAILVRIGALGHFQLPKAVKANAENLDQQATCSKTEANDASCAQPGAPGVVRLDEFSH